MAEQNTTQEIPLAPLEKENEDNNFVTSSASSTTPVHQHQLDTIDTIQDNGSSIDPPAQNIRRSIPQMFVFPHIFTKGAMVLLLITTIIMIIYIWLYLGAVWSPFTRIKNFPVVLYNADAGFDFSQTPPQLIPVFQGITGNSSLGSVLEKQIMNPQGALNKVVTWIDRSQETLSRDDIMNIVETGHAWGAIYIPSNFSNNFLSFAPTTSGPATAGSIKPVMMEYIFDQGRAYGTHSILEKAITKSMSALSLGFQSGLLTSPANQTLLQNMYPSLWVQTIILNETIMHPVLVYGQNFACYVTFIVLYIGSMLTVYTTTKFLPNTVETLGVLDVFDNQGQPTYTKFPALRIAFARYSLGAFFSTIHVIFIWMVPQVLNGHQMSDKYNAGIAFAFVWMVGKSFMSLLFFLCQVLTVDGFQLPATVFMILMFTSSGGILDWKVMPGFFRIGKAFPFTYAVKGMKALYFGSLTDDMWVNWLVISGWILIPLCAMLVMARSDVRLRREELRQKSRAQSTTQL